MTYTLLVQDYLRNGGTYESLLADHGVHAKPYNGKISLVYDQLEAKEDNPIACECRGLILREGTWDIIGHGFNRFFNMGQRCAAPVDWSTARFEDKRDGTLIIANWDNVEKRWFAATRSCCEGQGKLDNGITFQELADRAAKEYGYNDFNHIMISNGWRDHTYMFELTSPYNTIVCQYKKLELTLIGVRDLTTGLEKEPESVLTDVVNFDTIRTWNFNNLDHLIEVIKDWDPRHYEGVIVKDANFNRIKVKSPKYLAVAHASESIGASWRSACEAVISGVTPEINDMLPPLAAKRISILNEYLDKVTEATVKDYEEIREIDDMKSYAFVANTKPWASALFALKRGKAKDMKEFMKNCSADHVLDVLSKYGMSMKDL